MNYNFFAFIERMKYINRWSLMRCAENENVSEHSLTVAILSHALCIIENEKFGGDYIPDRAATLALYHDAPEIITGDIATPVKYFSDEIKTAYDKVETVAKERLLSMLPDYMQSYYHDILYSNKNDDKYIPIIKAADKLSAYLKCMSEIKTGNKEFIKASEEILAKIKKLDIPSVNVFLSDFADGYSKSLDEL